MIVVFMVDVIQLMMCDVGPIKVQIMCMKKGQVPVSLITTNCSNGPQTSKNLLQIQLNLVQEIENFLVYSYM